MNSTLRLRWGLLVFGVGFLLGLGLMMHPQNVFSPEQVPLGVDVYPRWVGARALWHGGSPYDEEVTRQTQQLIYGRPRHPGENAFRFYYPAYLSLVMFPLIFLPVTWASVIWSAAQWALLFTFVGLWSWCLKPRPAPWVWGILLLSGILFRPAMGVVINGQYGLFVLACGVLAGWFIVRGRDAWAGSLLALATIKPSVALLPVLVLLLWAAHWRRGRVILGFGTTMVLLVGVIMLRIGWWIPDFVQQSLVYAQDNLGLGLAWSPGEIWTASGLVWLIGIAALLGVGSMRLWRDSRLPWTAVMGALYLNLLITPHSAEYDLAILLIPLVWLGMEWHTDRRSLMAWILLVWTPWISWVFMIPSGDFMKLWWKVIWQFYPQLLLVLTLLWLARSTIRGIVDNIVPTSLEMSRQLTSR